MKRAAFSLAACLSYIDKQASDLRSQRCELGAAQYWQKKFAAESEGDLGRGTDSSAGTRTARWIGADALRELRSEAVQKRLRCKRG